MEENVTLELEITTWGCLLKIKNRFIFPSQEPSSQRKYKQTRSTPNSGPTAKGKFRASNKQGCRNQIPS